VFSILPSFLFNKSLIANSALLLDSYLKGVFQCEWFNVKQGSDFSLVEIARRTFHQDLTSACCQCGFLITSIQGQHHKPYPMLVFYGFFCKA